jgi:hypothetical protein
MLWYFLPPYSFHEIWETILESTDRPGLHMFRDIQILLHAKNLKIMTKDDSWQHMTQRFERYWTHAVLESYTSSEFYFDVGKEVCPSGPPLTTTPQEPVICIRKITPAGIHNQAGTFYCSLPVPSLNAVVKTANPPTNWCTGWIKRI